MKTKLLSLAVAVLGTPILAHAVNFPNPSDAACTHVPLAVAVLGTPILAHAVNFPNPSDAACTHVPPQLIIWANAVLGLLGLGPIC